MAEPVAVCGLGLRVPGHELIDTPDKFWEFLLSGEDASVDVPGWKWRHELHFDRDKSRKLKTKVVRGSFVQDDGLANVDCGFFNLSANEAKSMDPQHRMALQCSVEALWDACIDPEEYKGRIVDVVVGQQNSEHADLAREDRLGDAGAMVLGNARSMCPNRISFFFDFKGRSYSVDTACSSSLQAVDLAVQSLQAHQCELAVVVGVNFLCDPGVNMAFQSLGILSPDGRSKFCDAGANGYGRGEAVVALVLQRVQDAVRMNHSVYCTIRGARSSHDGNKDFMAFPSGEAQAALMKRVYEDHGLSPADTQYIEAHGTGTDAGDRTELGSIHSAMMEGIQGRPSGEKLLVGSVKSNCGHTEGAAGALGVAKVALMLYHGLIPPSLHMKNPHPLIPLEAYAMDVPQSHSEWPKVRPGMLRRAAVNSFGIGGSNAHVLLEEFSRPPSINTTPPQIAQAPYVLPLSGHTKKALFESVNVWYNFLMDKKQDFEQDPQLLLQSLHQVVYGRSHMGWRLCAIGECAEDLGLALKQGLESEQFAEMNPGEAKQAPELDSSLVSVQKSVNSSSGMMLENGTSGDMTVESAGDNTDDKGKTVNGEVDVEDPKKTENGGPTEDTNSVLPQRVHLFTSTNAKATGRKSLLFVFSGQGTQYTGMGVQLYNSEQVFRDVLDECNGFVQDEGGTFCLITELHKSETDSGVMPPNISLVLLPVVQICLVELLKFNGIEASGSLGHSSGEVAAAYCSGSLSRRDAVLLALARSKCVEEHALSLSAFAPRMTVVGTSQQQAEEMVKELDIDEIKDGKVVIAAINSGMSVTLSGDQPAVELVELHCKEKNIRTHVLKIGAAFHSHHMTEVGEALLKDLSTLIPTKSVHPLFSPVTGGCVSGTRLDAQYWKDNLILPVLFSDALTRAFKQGGGFDGIVEIGPRPVLASDIKMVLSDLPKQSQRSTPTFCPMVMDSTIQEQVQLRKTMCELYCHGFRVVWKSILFWPSTANKPISGIPTYPFQSRHVIKFGPQAKERLVSQPRHNLLGRRVPIQPVAFESYVDVKSDLFIRDHVIETNRVFPGVSFFEISFAAIQEIENAKEDSAIPPALSKIDGLTDDTVAADNKEGEVACKSYFVLRDAKFHMPLIFNDQFVVLQTTLDTTTNMVRIFSIAAKHQDDLVQADQGVGFQLHFSCCYAKYPLEPQVYEKFRREHAMGVERAREDCTIDVHHDVAYSKMWRMGLQLGPYMQRARNIRIGVDKGLMPVSSGNVLWSDDERYRFPHPYYVPPVVLDTSLHFSTASVLDTSTSFYIPDGCEEVVYIPPKTTMKEEMIHAKEWIKKDIMADRKGQQSDDSWVNDNTPEGQITEKQREEDGYFVRTYVKDVSIQGHGKNDILISHNGEPLFQMRGFTSVRLGNPKPDEIVPIEDSMFRTTWSTIEEDDQANEEESVEIMPVENHCLLLITPKPMEHAWVTAINRSEDLRKGFEEVYPSGIWIGDSAAHGLQMMENSTSGVDLMYVSAETELEPIDMEHALVESQTWLKAVSPGKDGPQAAHGSNLYFVTFGANVEGSAIGGSCLLGFGRTVASEYVNVKAHLFDLEAQVECNPFDACTKFLKMVFMNGKVRSNLELGIRGERIVIPRLVRIDIQDAKNDDKALGESAPINKDDAPPEETVENGALDQPESDDSPATRDNDSPPNYCLVQTQKGNLDSLSWHEVRISKITSPENLIVEVDSVGINFKDTLLVMGILDRSAFASGWTKDTIGIECAGIVRSVGPEVSGIAVGDRVVGFPRQGQTAFQKFLEMDGLFVHKIPPEMDFSTASGLLVTGLTAHFCIEDWGTVGKGDIVLVHSAAGGVGLLCVQMALRKGATVIATASLPKHDLVKQVGAHHVFNSRTMDFVQEVREVTDGYGVDVVINSLYGAATQESINLLAPLGRFVEIGKRDIMEGSSILMKAFLRNCSYKVLDLDSLITEDIKNNKEKRGRAFKEAAEKVSRDFTSSGMQMPVTVYPAAQIGEAFRYMSEGKHVGKISIKLPSLGPMSHEPLKGADSPQMHLEKQQVEDLSNLLTVDETYVFVGGTSGLTLSIAISMILSIPECKHVALLSRTGGTNSKKLQNSLRHLRYAVPSINVQAFAVDVANEEQLSEFLQKVRSGQLGNFPPKIGGIMHAAMVLRDKQLSETTPQDLHEVMAPKATGAYLLHKLTLQDNLRFFVMFSSVSTVVGNNAQGTYSAANSYLEGLAKYRRLKGLPGRCIQWGPVADVGVVGRNAALTVMSSTETAGVQLTTPEQVIKGMMAVLFSDILGVNVPLGYTTRRTVPVLVSDKQDESVEVDEISSVILIAALNLPFLAGMFPAHAASPKLKDLIAGAKKKMQATRKSDKESTQVGAKVLQLVADNQPAAAVVEVANAVGHIIGNIAGINPDGVDHSMPLTSFGLNSLQWVQFKSWADSMFMMSVPLTNLGKDTNVGMLAEFVVDKVVEGFDKDNMEADAQQADSYLPQSTDQVPGVHMKNLAHNPKHRGKNKKLIEEVVFPSQNPEQIIFLFPGFVEEAAAFQELGNHVQSSGHLSTAIFAVVHMDYQSNLKDKESWSGYVESIAISIRKHMETTWALHRSDALSLPFQFLGHSLGAYAILEVSALLKTQGLYPSQLVAMHMTGPVMYEKGLHGHKPSKDGYKPNDLLMDYFQCSPWRDDVEEASVLASDIPISVVYSTADGFPAEDVMASWKSISAASVTFFENIQGRTKATVNPDIRTRRALRDALFGSRKLDAQD